MHVSACGELCATDSVQRHQRLIIGAFYVLMALGLSLILNLSNVINFAHGGFLVIGGYIAYTITPYIGFWGALLLAPPLTAVIGLRSSAS